MKSNKLIVIIWALVAFISCNIPHLPKSTNTPKIIGIMDTNTMILEGRIITMEKIGVEDAKVEIAHHDRPNEKKIVTSNSNGRYFFKHISGGKYNIVVYKDSIQIRKLTNVILFPSHIMQLDIMIKKYKGVPSQKNPK